MKATPGVPLTKVSPPSLDMLVQTLDRKDLTDPILSRFDSRLTLISSGAGTGKTTLLMQVISRIQREIVWINLDESDAGLTDFVYLILYAIQKKHRNAGDKLERFLTHHASSSQDTRILANLLIETFLENDPFILILDDFHTVSESAPILELVEFLIDRLPSRWHVVLSSRRGFMFKKLPQWRMRRWVTEISERELMFRPEQITQLLDLLGIPKPHLDMKVQLHQLSDGWIGIIILLLSRAKATPDFSVDTGALTSQDNKLQSLEYIIQEVLLDMPDAYRDFIIRTSICERLIVSEVNEFLSRNDSGMILEHLSKNNWLTSLYSTTPVTYRYHTLLRDSAYSILLRECSGEALHALHLQYGRFLEGKQQFFEAIDQYRKAESFEEATRLLAQITRLEADSLWENRIIRSISDIPDQYYSDHPKLLLLKSKELFRQNRRSDAIRFAEQSIAAFLADNDRDSALNACWHKVNIMQFEPKKAELELACRQALDIAGNTISISRLYIEMLWLRFFESSDNLGALKKLILQSLSIAEAHHDQLKIAREYSNLATLYHMTIGEFREAAEIYERQIPIYEKFGYVEQLCVCCFNQGICYFHMGEIDSAVLTFNRIWRLCEENDLKVYLMPSMTFLASIYADSGKYSEALELIQRIADSLQEVPYSYVHHHLLFARTSYHAARGEEQEAIEFVDRYCRLAAQTESETIVSQAIANKGEVLTKLRRWDEARVCLLQAIDYFSRMKRYYGVAYCRVHLAIRCLFDTSRESLDDLKIALTLAREHQFNTLFLSQRDYRRLLVVALRENIETDYVSGLFSKIKDLDFLLSLIDCGDVKIQKIAILALESFGHLDHVQRRLTALAQRGKPMIRKMAQSALDRSKSSGLDPLRIQCFKSFKVWIGSSLEPLSDRAWRLSRAKKIFRYLLLHRKQPIHQEVLIDVFWPDSDLNKGIQSLHHAMHCIRKALENTESVKTEHSESGYLICQEHHYLLVLPSESEVDYDLFLKQMTAVKSTLSSGNLLDARKHLLRLSEIYIGDLFSEDLYDEWVASIRQRIQMEFADTALRMATRLLQSGFADDAVQMAGLVLQRDAYNEDAVAIRMKGKIESGLRFQAIEEFRRFQELIVRELKSEPSDYICRLYQRII